MSTTVSLDWDEFEMAFMIGSPDAMYLLNTQTGVLEYVSHLDDEEGRQTILDRAQGDVWVEIPRASTPEGLAEIQLFISTESDSELKARLEASMESANAFVAFNQALGGATPARKRWTVGRIRGMHRRLLDFCAARDLVIDDPRFTEIKASLSS
jgi:hypothetical protein